MLRCSSFGEVYIAERIADNWTVVVKICKGTASSVQTSQEGSLIQTLNSDFIVRYEDVFTKGNSLWVAFGGFASFAAGHGVLSMRIAQQLYSERKQAERAADSRHLRVQPVRHCVSAQQECFSPRTPLLLHRP